MEDSLEQLQARHVAVQSHKKANGSRNAVSL